MSNFVLIDFGERYLQMEEKVRCGDKWATGG